MNPNSFSASSLQVADECLARYKAQFIDRGKDLQGTAANVGIVCHGTLEDFLRAVFITKRATWDEHTLRGMFNDNFDKVFGASRTIEEYEDAWNLLCNWFYREGQEDYLRSVKILSLESKNSFTVKHPKASGLEAKPFNYIMDRVDRLDETTVKVVDYKTQRTPLTHDQLRKKKQARYYALAIQVIYPNTEQIWVEFDFLRHSPVAVMFTREDNVDTYREMQRATARVLQTPDDKAPETLNANCGWCIRKASCKALKSNIKVGGIMSMEVDDLAELYGNLVDQQKAQKELLAQIEGRILNYAIEEDLTEFETPTATVTLTLPARRTVNNAVAAAVLGVQASEYANFTVTTIDKLLRKTSSLSPAQRTLLKEAIEIKYGDPAVKIESKNAF